MMIKKMLLVASAAVITAAIAQTPGVPEISKAAPALKLTDTNGKTHALSDFAGKYVVLEWTNHQCPFVVKHYNSGNMQRQQKWAKENGVVWLCIVSSAEGKQGYVTAAEGNKVMKDNGFFATAMLLDSDGAVGKLYGAKTTPHMYIINPKQELIYMGGIDDNRGGDVSKPTDYVIQALKESMAGKPVSKSTSQPYGCSVKYK